MPKKSESTALFELLDEAGDALSSLDKALDEGTPITFETILDDLYRINIAILQQQSDDADKREQKLRTRLSAPIAAEG